MDVDPRPVGTYAGNQWSSALNYSSDIQKRDESVKKVGNVANGRYLDASASGRGLSVIREEENVAPAVLVTPRGPAET